MMPGSVGRMPPPQTPVATISCQLVAALHRDALAPDPLIAHRRSVLQYPQRGLHQVGSS